MSSFRISYQTIDFDGIDIHVRTLRDNQQFCDTDNVAEKLGISSATWPYFGIIWDSSIVLAHFLRNYDVDGKRILEVGCGIGLVSLLLNHRLADITATDYHPEAGKFLLENVTLNKGVEIPFFLTNWADDTSSLGLFDLIVGSDLLYERNHVDLLSAFINHHANSECEIILAGPSRGYHNRFTKKMTDLGYTYNQISPGKTDYLKKPYVGHILKYNK